MRSKGFEGMTCSIASVLGALGDRWGALIMRDMLLGLRRYDDFRQSTGITNATLTDRLKVLEHNQLIERRLYQTRPDRHEYLLTPKGTDIALVVMALAQIGDQWDLDERGAPPLNFINGRTGNGIKVALLDEVTGEPVRLRDVRVEEGPAADDMIRWRLAKAQEYKATAQ
ncbi:winged helix-turn-helix transcriptional regulator [Pseudomonas vancouverensis]|uniref:Transcriptional regulator n=1 Tax=Pseudomonas vancouverensis TaxID=95300 RepID=A0A1H2N3S4_PSEVA|nr:helix-turn-helix domain-containing protein [Pseudomonas vancouverensis]KAB0495767.1 helix-turn-helix transcriptional regulator [Pseudomonas vancouverensis]TDB65569.1 transcriptional regulator [Pseudomonas vancouverensis]SDU99436.1 transcriptional regulator, HxlR family [Pseudomonas vancouverensis]